MVWGYKNKFHKKKFNEQKRNCHELWCGVIKKVSQKEILTESGMSYGVGL